MISSQPLLVGACSGSLALDEGEVFVVQSVANVPNSMWLRAALKGLTIMTELAFETTAQKGALLKLKGQFAMHMFCLSVMLCI